MNLSAETKSFIRDNLDVVNAFISHRSNVWITLTLIITTLINNKSIKTQS